VSLQGQIKDGTGSEYVAQVTRDHALKVTQTVINVSDLTPDELTRRRYFNDFLTVSGGSSIEMNVDGSTTPVSFDIKALTGFVIFVERIRFVFHDTNMDMGGGNAGRFASAAAAPGLTNGLLLSVTQGGDVTEVFSLPVQVMGDFFQYSEDFTNITGAFGAGVDFLAFDFEFREPVPLSVPISDKVEVLVRDDLTSLDLFHAIATGVKEVAV
jgi:hypothetical protein